MPTTTPPDLGAGGLKLWRAITRAHKDLDAGQVVTLTQACRMKDRCDELAALVESQGPDSRAHDREQSASAALARLITALRLPDESTGKKPQRRGVRGVQAPSRIGGASVSSLDRARAAAGL